MIPHTSLPPQFTFILHDAGETKAMQPVMQELSRESVPYRILADATARQLLQGDPNLVPTPQEVETLARQGSPWAAFIQAKLQEALQAPCVVSGLVSQFQQQWTAFFDRQASA